MDGCSIKLDRIAPVMNDFIEKLQNFETLATSEKKGLAIRGILISVEDLRNCLKESIVPKDVKSQMSYIGQVERMFSEFNWDVNYTMKPNEYPKFITCCKNLAASIMKLLGKRNCGILVVDLYFKMCEKVVNELSINVEDQVNVLKDLLLFQMLVKGYLSSVRVLRRFWYVIVPPQQKCSVMLCLNQAFKTLCFLGKVIDKRLTHLIAYLLSRLKQCFNKIVELLGNQVDQCQNSEFIILMDSCLNKLDQFGYGMTHQEDLPEDLEKTLLSLKSLIDELLCHAMTVSHISNRDYDCNMIKSYSQKVLDEFKNMNATQNRSDLAFIADKLSDLLCQLEETVNDTILNVVLDVFTDVNDPVRNLVNKCNQSEDSLNRSATDLESEISEFDEHMDRLMHIGLFAVSCSTDVRKILGIRSCLASLESLEAELVTSVISLYLNSNPETRVTFQFIFRNWMEEVTDLKNLMDLILDPRAFCQVVEKRITILVNEIREDDVSVSVPKVRCNLCKILSFTKKLIKTLTRIAEHEEENVKKRMMELIESLRLGYQECEASQALLDEEISPGDMSKRIVKRVLLIITSIRNIIQNLAEDDISQEVGDGKSKIYSRKVN
ncbi:UNVERIFIED_CONTAM: hypothetical protein PYX00_007114 [Menopon gallinae]|uniref:Uncharacterized protein n=1 Tax=Menopon gallinae TaxID=328185 RepID=A0AAW2HIE1_9NEOP